MTLTVGKCANFIDATNVAGMIDVYDITADVHMIAGPATVWWFEGEHPPGYDTIATLKSAAGASTSWEVVSGASRVHLTPSAGEQTAVTSTGTTFSGQLNDIIIRATSADGVHADYSMTSRTPYRLLPATSQTFCDQTYGYVTQVPYAVMDQLDDPLPYDVPANEQWTTPVFQDYPGTNWVRADEWSNNTGGLSLVDTISGPNQEIITPPVPVPTCDGNSQPVDHWGQAWRIGSLTIGLGKLVQTDVLRGLVGKAMHTDIVSPVQ